MNTFTGTRVGQIPQPPKWTRTRPAKKIRLTAEQKQTDAEFIIREARNVRGY